MSAVLEQTRDQWLEERRTYLGGSDVAAILGENTRKTPLQVWHDKKGLGDSIDNPKMRFGREFESYIVDRYEEIVRDQFEGNDALLVKVNRQPGLRRHPEYEFFGANPDGVLCHAPGILECKSGINHPGTSWSWGAAWTDQVPRSYLIQGVWYCGIWNMDFVDFAFFDRETCETTPYRVWRDMEYESLLFSFARDWWIKHVINDVEPLPVEGDLEKIAEKFPTDNGQILQASEAQEALVYRMIQLKKQAAPLYAEAKDIEAQIKALMGENQALAGTFGKVTWKNNADKSETDWEALARENTLMKTEDAAALIAKYTTVKPGSRVFRAPK